MIANSHGHIYYTHNNNIIAFTFYKIIGLNYLSVEFAWDYAIPKLSLGHVSLYLESLLRALNAAAICICLLVMRSAPSTKQIIPASSGGKDTSGQKMLTSLRAYATVMSK